MSFEAKVFRILIASPSDVVEEREIAVRTIQEWNDLNSAERQIALLPLRWETHTAPEYGRRPQEVINRQIVDKCDLLIGVFWTRIGSPTGEADSGTLEEIERVASAGKPVMLYFSQVKKDPNDIELDQLKKLREFKSKTFPKALVETYSSPIEFRDKLAKQIEIQLRGLIVSDSKNDTDAIYSGSDITLEFYDPDNDVALGTKHKVESEYLDVSNMESVPDYEDPSKRGASSTILFGANKDYYREYLEYLVNLSLFRRLAFRLENRGSIGARDIYIDFRISTKIKDLGLKSSASFIIKKPKPDREPEFSIPLGDLVSGEHLNVSNADGPCRANIEIKALQPKREIITKNKMLISATMSGVVTFDANIYADTLSEPLRQKLELQIKVTKQKVDALELLGQSGVTIKQPDPESDDKRGSKEEG